MKRDELEWLMAGDDDGRASERLLRQESGLIAAQKAEAGQLVEQFGLKVAPVMLPERAAFHHSVGAGKTAPEIEPQGKAAEDIASLWAWVCERVRMPTRKQVSVKRGVA